MTAVAGRIKISNVVKIAMPPPRGTTVLWYLSVAGCATKFVRIASFLTAAVKIRDSTNEPESKIIANIVNVSILAAPVTAFLSSRRNQNNTAVYNPDRYRQEDAMSLCQR